MSSATDAVREVVALRSGGQCEVRTSECTGRANGWHHRLRTGQGGPTSPENCIAVCDSCHTLGREAIHRNIAKSEAAGLLIRRWQGAPTDAWSPEEARRMGLIA